eukprot:386615-Prymnesium_polylepis.1
MRMSKAPVRTIVTYNDYGGVSRQMSLWMSRPAAAAWVESVQALLKVLPRHTGSPAHWRWSLSCMAVISSRGSSGSLLQSDLRALLRCANASSLVSNEVLDRALESVKQSERQQMIPPWLLAHGDGNLSKKVRPHQVAGLLLRLSTASPRITEQYNSHAIDDWLGLDGWLDFQRSEQLANVQDDALVERASAGASVSAEPDTPWRQQLTIEAARFERASIESHTDGKLSSLSFALQLLHLQNDTVAGSCGLPSTADLAQPLTHYWMATSHSTAARV